MKFSKYHALGNDYIVIDPADLQRELTETVIKTLCDRHYGFGSDGVLYGPLPSAFCDFSLRIFNPDASKAEKSGNGLRIFSRYLLDRGLVDNSPFSIETIGGAVVVEVADDRRRVCVNMGRIRFGQGGTIGTEPQAQTLQVVDRTFRYYFANVGNPHCVILVDDLSSCLATQYGPQIECLEQFPERTNVQFVKVIDRSTIQIEIWERGAGYTFASGSSSTAAASVLVGLGLCDRQVKVLMPGGRIDITLDDEFNATMCGDVCRIGEGVLSPEALGHLSE